MNAFRLAMLVTIFWFLSFTAGRSIIDPIGGSPTLDGGDHHCTIDPNGGPCTTTTFQGDRGAGLDPNG
jgi:hypothetical protein